MAEEVIYKVGEFNSIASRLLSSKMPSVKIMGELSSISYSQVGDCYITISDETGARLSCSLYKNRMVFLPDNVKVGDGVIVTGSPIIYKSGSFNLTVYSIKLAGLGAILERIRQNEEKWRTTYFARPKRQIPDNVQNIFVVTSSKGKVIHDIIETRNLRNPSVNIYLYPAIVEGMYCAASISEKIRLANDHFKKVVKNPELNKRYGFSYSNTVLIVARGGGAFEALLPFYEEEVVKAVSESELIIISAIGHDYDRPSCDLAADLRASVPAQAVELAIKHNRPEELRHLQSLKRELESSFFRLYEGEKERFNHAFSLLKISANRAVDSSHIRFMTQSARLFNLAKNLTKTQLNLINDYYSNLNISLNSKLLNEREKLSGFKSILNNCIDTKIKSSKGRFLLSMQGIKNFANKNYEIQLLNLRSFTESLEHLNPNNVLSRGYTAVVGDDGRKVTATNIENGNYRLYFADGHVDSTLHINSKNLNK